MVYVDNAQRGPYSVPQLENFLQRGELTSSAFVWTEGMTDWQPITTIVTPSAPSRPAAPPVFAPRTPQPLTPVTAFADFSVKENDYTFMLVAHILMAASIVTGVTGIIAVIMAYIKRDELRGTYLESHAKNIIETFWWSVGLTVIGVILTFAVIGIFVLIGAFIWFVYRCIIGIVRISERKAI